MNGGDPTLAAVQRWMQTVITDPAGVAAGVASVAAQRELPIAPNDIEQVIPRSHSQTSLERLAVYSHAYFARLLECLRGDFPALCRAVGDSAANALFAGYLRQHPPASYTLNDLAARFPDYLRATRPNRDAPDLPDRPDFLIELASLERIYSEVFDGPGEEADPPLSMTALQSIPVENRAAAKLLTSRSLRLVVFQFPVHEYAASVRTGQPVELPSPRFTRLAVSRRNCAVQRRELDAFEFAILSALQQGRSLGAALEEAAEAAGANSSEDLPGRVERIFQNFTAAGYFRAVE